MTPPNTPKVLIVEDEAPLLELYSSILSNKKIGGVYDVSTAASAEIADDILRENNFDVLLSDYRLPGKDGIELIRDTLIRSSHTQCLILSGFVDTGLVRSALETGARACLKKPCSISELLAAVSSAAEESMRLRAEEPTTDKLPRKELSALRISTALEANQIYTVFIDSEYNIKFANTSFREDYADYAGRRCYEVTGSSNQPCRGCPAVAATEADSARAVLRRGRSPKGGLWELEEKVKPWFEEGKIRGLILSFTPTLHLQPFPEPVEGD